MNPGSRFGPYEILAPLGTGGMGAVYRATDTRLRRDVAIKLLNQASGAGDAARLLREARLAATLNHPHVCTIHEVGEVDGTPFMAMELVGGETLQAVLQRGPLDADRLCRIGGQLADALEHAHVNGIVHGDFKSANVMIAADGRAKVLDFGIARRVADAGDVTRTATVQDAQSAHAGTLSYMAPEQLSGGEPSVKSDIWALGVVLYEMASGHRPFSGNTRAAIAASILRDTPPALPPTVPPGVVRLIERCLCKDPGERPSRAGEVAMGLSVIDARHTALPSATARSRPVMVIAAAAVLLAAIGGALLLRSRGSAGKMPAVNAIAVLPFDNLSRATDQEYFSDGMTDLLITELSKVGALRVTSRGSVLQYRSRSKPAADIARELHVDALVQGAVLREGDRVRITVSLVNPVDGRLLWSDRYERDVKDVLGLQSDIATVVVTQVRASIAPDEARRLQPAAPRDARAQDAYLLGRYHLLRKTSQDLKQALTSFQDAIRIDPQFAAAHAGLADTYEETEIWGGAGVGTLTREIKQAAQQALALDNSLAEAHVAMAAAFSRDWNWAAAGEELRRAITLNSSLVPAHQQYSFYLQTTKHEAEALAEAHLASVLDPFNVDVLSNEGRVLFRARRYEQSLAVYLRATEIDPNFPPVVSRLLDDYIALGQLDKAERQLERIKAISNTAFAIRSTALLYGKQGRTAEARALLAREQAASVSGIDPAYVLMAMGDYDAALGQLEQAVKDRSILPCGLRDPRFDPVSASPRFAAILKSVNLEP